MFANFNRPLPLIRRLFCAAAMAALTACASAPTSTSGPAPGSAPPAVSKTQTLDNDAEKFAANLSRAQAQQPAGPAANRAPAAAAPEVLWTNAQPKAVPPAAPPITAAPPKVDPVPAAPAAPVKPPELTASEMIQNLSDRLKHDSRAGQLRPYLARAALTLADPRREMTEADIPELPAEDRKLVLAYQRAFSALARTLNGDPGQNRQQLLTAVEELQDQVSNNRQMTIRTAKLCTKVSGYGVYTTFDKSTFIAGREQPIIVYAELDRFGAQLDDEGQNVVRLTQQIVLYNESDGLAVWKVKPTEIIDKSRNRRRDFFVVQIINLPSRLTVGKYNMKLTVTDQVSQTVDETSIPIQIVADGDLASKP